MNRTKIDAHAFRWQRLGGFQGASEWGPFEKCLSGMFADAPATPVIVPRARGWKGYESSADIRIGDMDVGMMAFGGRYQRGWAYASFQGRGCEWVTDWERAEEALEALPEYSAKRTDIALDVFDGSSGFDSSLVAYRAGGFSPPGAGRPPKCEPMKPERLEDSAIIRVGNRESDKYYRGYEKGKQLYGAACLDSEAVQGIRLPLVVDGETVMVPAALWFRHELELKAKTCPLPLDLIERRDEYFAGAYPYLGNVLAGVEPQILVMRRERGPQLDLSLSLDCLRKQWGPTLFTALTAFHGDIGALMQRIVGTEHNERLVRSGVLLVDHE